MKTIDADLFLKMLEKGHEDGSICGPEDVEKLVQSMPSISSLRSFPIFRFPQNEEAITINIIQSKKAGEKSTVSIKYPYDGQVYGTYISFDEIELSHRMMLDACKELLVSFQIAMEELNDSQCT